MQLLGAAAAERIGINVTDLNCLNILALSGQLTAGELARATGLTTASITGVLDRLEEAGFVRRERDATTGAGSSSIWTRPAGCATSPRSSRRWSRPGGRPRPSTPTSSWPSSWASRPQLEQIMRDRLVELRGDAPA